MRYFGGKSRIAADIAAIIKANSTSRLIYEPFCGGCSVTVALANAGFKVEASDSNEYVIAMWQETMQGRVMPYTITEDDYKAAKTTDDKALKGFVGCACAFGGKWFGGYARGGSDYAFAGSQSVFKKVRAMNGAASFSWLQFYEVKPDRGSIIYCDPPYGDTVNGYHASFDSYAFSAFLENNWRDCDVYVSEYTSPGDSFDRVASFAQKVRLSSRTTEDKQREDNLYFRPARNH